MEHELRRMFETKEADMAVPTTLSPELRNRIGRQRMVMGGLVAVAALALVIGGFAGARSLSRDEALPPATPDSKETTESSGGRWPQSSLEEARRAQRLADAGDLRYTWQVFPELPPFLPSRRGGKLAVEPGDVELFTRFLQEKLGWEDFSWGVGPELYPPENWPHQFVVVRCAPGETNALYPNDPDGRECAPTIDENRYETVRISADQLGRAPQGVYLRSSKIWVVTRWEMLQPSDAPVTGLEVFRHQIQQVEPVSDAKATEFLRTFLQARVDGAGAEQYLRNEGAFAPLLYTPACRGGCRVASPSGPPYERFELELVRGPVWPSGWRQFKVRLFAEGERTLVEQVFVDRREDGRLMVLQLQSSGDETVYGES